MTPHLSSPFPLSKPLPILPHQPIPRTPTPQKPIQVLNSTRPHRTSPHHKKKIGSPEPPWLLLPPPAPVNPFSAETPPLFYFQLKSPATGIPFSLRLVQLRKKSKNSPRPRSSSPSLGSVGNAVWSLASLMEEIQRSILSEDDELEETVESVSRDTGDSIVWLFRKVFSSSPNLAVGLLVLMAEFFVVSMERRKPKVLAVVEEPNGSKLGPPEIGRNYGCWSDIGILDDADKTALVFDPDYIGRRCMAYENMIANEKTNSLILSNYAQLLYQYEKDFDRANHYFSWAVNAQPVDGEAMSRYALFLWHGRGDLEGAEEMFLEAIQADPESDYHRSNYAWFLWTTGGQDTCFPLEDNEEGDCQEL
ncbi:putative TPR repeat-containing protein [Cocos nucifera]|uniref:Putative TPR repeat-containing protein n=1 Tax=Cocos nucifera TaxID=13894 RepID=A0A8K0IFX4_COCNU|nr:putative TPR repeat-containing protein [Cocos nucifera]